MLLIPCIISFIATVATLFMSPLENGRSGWKKRMTCIAERVILSPWLLKKSSSLRSPFGEHSHGTQIYSLYLPIQRSLSTYLFLRLYCHQFSIHVTFKSLPMQPNHWPQNMNYRRLVPLTIFPSKQNEQQSALLEVLPTGRISLHHCPSGISQKGAVVLQLSTFE